MVILVNVQVMVTVIKNRSSQSLSEDVGRLTCGLPAQHNPGTLQTTHVNSHGREGGLGLAGCEVFHVLMITCTWN